MLKIRNHDGALRTRRGDVQPVPSRPDARGAKSPEVPSMYTATTWAMRGTEKTRTGNTTDPPAPERARECLMTRLMTAAEPDAPPVIVFVAVLTSALLCQGEAPPSSKKLHPLIGGVDLDAPASLRHRVHHRGGPYHGEGSLHYTAFTPPIQARPSGPRGPGAPRAGEREIPNEGEPSPPAVKVVTFNQGRFDPPILEPLRFWPRGHTAVIIDGHVRSFEAHWQCGETEAKYKKKNEWRGAWVQVLDLPASDAARIKEDFRRSCGTGVFLLTGVCTSSAGRLLQNALADLEITWAPIRLRRQLAESGYVERTYRWHRTVWRKNVARCMRRRSELRAPLGTVEARLTEDRLMEGSARRARDRCLRQLGLAEQDIALPGKPSGEAVRLGARFHVGT